MMFFQLEEMKKQANYDFITAILGNLMLNLAVYSVFELVLGS